MPAALPLPSAADADPLAGCQAADLTIAELVAQAYETAPPEERRHLLAHLVRPVRGRPLRRLHVGTRDPA